MTLLKRYIDFLKSRDIIWNAIVVYDRFAITWGRDGLHFLMEISNNGNILVKEIPITHNDIVDLWSLTILFLNSNLDGEDPIPP